ncbi:MAG: hypothetical protein JNM93_02295 [Bacteriovoracaceae bacterium]|nr:hypothetical protein [Bacteriovoracaceae bacterium]
MKTVIAIDTLIERDDSIHYLELMLHMFPEAEIYTLVHCQGKIGGNIESHKIHSTFLSHMVKSKTDFRSKLWLVPGAIKQLAIPSDVEQIVVISCGYIHRLATSEKIKRINYFYRYNFTEDILGLFVRKLFAPFLAKWIGQDIPGNNFYCSQSIKKFYPYAGEVLPPVVRTDDFPLFEAQATIENQITIMLDENDVTTEEKLKPLFANHNLSLIRVNPMKCDGDFAAALKVSSAFIDLRQQDLPYKCLQAFAAGRPVMAIENDFSREFLTTSGALFIKSKNDIANALPSFLNFKNNVDSKFLRREALKYNGRIFKSRVGRFLTFEV